MNALKLDDGQLRLRMLSFKKQSRNIGLVFSNKFTEEEATNAERFAGGAICPDCQLEYFDHPQLTNGVANGLTVTCQGKLVKL